MKSLGDQDFNLLVQVTELASRWYWLTLYLFTSLPLLNPLYCHISPPPSISPTSPPHKLEWNEALSLTFSSCWTKLVYTTLTIVWLCLSLTPLPLATTVVLSIFEFILGTSISGITEHLYFCYWLISVNIMSSTFNYVLACRISPFKSVILIMCIYHICLSITCLWIPGLLLRFCYCE